MHCVVHRSQCSTPAAWEHAPAICALAFSIVQVIKEVLPLLEDIVSSDYPLWRPAGALVAGARPDGAAAASTGAASGRSVSSQNMGQGGVSTMGGWYAAC